MTTKLIPTTYLSKHELNSMLEYLQEVHEDTKIEIKHRDYRAYRGDKLVLRTRVEIIFDSEVVGQVLHCTRCGYQYDELGEGNYVYDLTHCDGCGEEIVEFRTF